MKEILDNKLFIRFTIKLIIIFLVLYYGTITIIGLTVKGGFYSPFIHDHLDYISALRKLILDSSNFVCHFLGFQTHLEGKYVLRDSSGCGVRMVYSCIGYGIMSFWIAFVLANKGPLLTKCIWIAAGLTAIFMINVIRVSLLLISVIKGHRLPLNIDHHTVFNLIAYILIFAMIYIYEFKAKLNYT